MATDFDYGALLVLALDTNDAESLREQIEAAFVSREEFTRNCDALSDVVAAQMARAEAAEAEVARLQKGRSDAYTDGWDDGYVAAVEALGDAQ